MFTEQAFCIRKIKSDDIAALWRLFYDAVHITAAKSYSPEQLNAWAPRIDDLSGWTEKMDRLNPFVIEYKKTIVGYADLQEDGLIDHFFVAPAYNRRGAGSRLMRHIIDTAKQKKIGYLYANVSINAQPFFARFGFQIEKQQRAICRGVALKNARMTKDLA